MKMISVAVVLLILLFLRLWYERRRDSKLPPGPPRLPLIGNLHQAPAIYPWRTYDKWLKQYGPIISCQFGGNTVIIIGDQNIARDLLDKRANIYSDRPRMVMAGECLTKGMHMLLRPYNERYLLHQRIAAPALSPRASNTYYPLQDLESKHLLLEFLTKNDFRHRFERFSASLVYSLAYGYRIITLEEQSIKDAHQVQENFAYAGQIGTWIVDAIPALNSLPDALAPWRKTADKFFQLESAMHMRNLNAGLNCKGWTWSKEFKASKEAQEVSELELAYNLGIVADAGLDTTTMVMEVFVLAALSYPEFIRAAQEELDRVVGQDRLPELEDRDNLPYIRAVVEETLRWRSIVPGGIAHATLKEDTYMDFKIPKGATVLPNFWSMRLDENLYEKPLEFRPERWIGKPDGLNNFGYGRRICTGRHIARNSVFILISRLLWSYNITHEIDGNGNKIEVDDMDLTSGFVSKPKPFPAVFEPRSDKTRDVIINAWNDTEKDVSIVLDSIRDKQLEIGLNLRA